MESSNLELAPKIGITLIFVIEQNFLIDFVRKTDNKNRKVIVGIFIFLTNIS